MIWVEVVGYAGTALILLSMTMTSLAKLRLLNILGSVLSVIYAWITGAMPVLLLNLCLTVINSLQLFRLYNQKRRNMDATDN